MLTATYLFIQATVHNYIIEFLDILYINQLATLPTQWTIAFGFEISDIQLNKNFKPKKCKVIL